ncbi:MAG TPA: phosphatidylglycerophosphatase A [Smithellaceae bacterium]|nr:phosphatidylglycerophosphatase A [Smithellaceae bacterium]HRS82759.1 phosphatidylglycerophosphatase A [Smithellaceae bacterium]HRV44423.1 phosphatidylglycerophosphatase A [Smithellaceae bacterium]
MATSQKDKWIMILATGCGAGLSPVAPGTAGTLAGVLVCLASSPLPWLFRVLFVVALSAVSIYVAGESEKLYKNKDDQRIVIDEIAGYQVAMLPVAVTGLHLLTAFVLFRIFDIWKPFPLKHFQKFPGGWGVVTDDLGAGVYTGIVILILVFLA